MPTTLKKHTINNLSDFTAFVEKTLTNPDVIAWYRGCGKEDYELIPTLYRHPTIKDVNQLLDLEKKIISRFKQRSVPYLNRQLINEWEYLFFMQHYRIPTRLLDWTEHPYIALFFALTSANFSLIKNEYTDNAAVWVLDPISWNRKVLKHISFREGILSQEDQQLTGHSPMADISMMMEEPLALYGTHNSPRIVAQRGVFCIFGKSLNSMEYIYEIKDFPQDSLIKLIIPKEHISSLLYSIISIGYTDSVIFPDLDGLANELKRFFKYRV